MGATLSAAMILALIVRPDCGAVDTSTRPGQDFAEHLVAIALQESGDRRTFADPLTIGINGPDGGSRHFANVAEAVASATALIAQGRSIDLGLMQINSGQLARHGLTVDAAFDACRNVAAAARHYADDVRAVYSLASARYNTGTTGTARGIQYAAGVEQIVERVRGVQAADVAPASAPVSAPPTPPPSAPEWDLFGRARSGSQSLFHINQ